MLLVWMACDHAAHISILADLKLIAPFCSAVGETKTRSAGPRTISITAYSPCHSPASHLKDQGFLQVCQKRPWIEREG